MRRLAAFVALALLAGCSGSPKGHDGPAGGGGPMVEDEPFAQEFDAAARDLARKVEEKSASGWPAGVPLSSEQPARPVVRLEQLMNRSPRHVDMTRLEDLVMQRLLDGGRVKVLAKGVESTDGPFLLLEGSLDESVERTEDQVTRDVTVSLRIVDPRQRAVVVQSRSEFKRVEER